MLQRKDWSLELLSSLAISLLYDWINCEGESAVAEEGSVVRASVKPRFAVDGSRGRRERFKQPFSGAGGGERV